MADQPAPFKELNLADEIGLPLAKIIAEDHGVDVEDLYIFRPSIRDHTEMGRKRTQEFEMERDAVKVLQSCVRTGNREKVIKGDKVALGDPTAYRHAYSICMGVIMEFEQETQELLKKRMPKEILGEDSSTKKPS